MKNLLRIIFAAVTASALMAGTFAPTDAVARTRPSPTRAFDGLWSVTIVTVYGNCDRGYRYPLAIQGGQVVKADSDSSYQVGGAVARSGAIQVTVSGGGQTATGYGRLTRNRGYGVWRTSTGECSGRWSAERRG
jgi:hypothetical protein